MLPVLEQTGSLGYMVVGMTIVVLSGGIDLSIGAMFALCNFVSLLLVQLLLWPPAVAICITLATGAALGAVNGWLIGYIRLRAFLTTLITLIIYKALYDTLVLAYGQRISQVMSDSDFWNWLGLSTFQGIGIAFWGCLIVSVMAHLFMTRIRPGLHIQAIGGSRRAAVNAGLPVARSVFLCYVLSGLLAALSAIFFAAKLGALGSDIGVGLELNILCGVIIGGVSLGGGRGSIAKALIGYFVVTLMINGLMSMSLSGGVINAGLALTLIVGAIVDRKINGQVLYS
jgi:ribose transport system permease protein